MQIVRNLIYTNIAYLFNCCANVWASMASADDGEVAALAGVVVAAVGDWTLSESSLSNICSELSLAVARK